MLANLYILLLLASCATVQCLSDPKVHVLSPNELKIELDLVDGLKLITFRIGVKRENNVLEDLEKGENVVVDKYIFIRDKRLNLKKGDVVNFLVAYRDNDGYQAQTGTLLFDGTNELMRAKRYADVTHFYDFEPWKQWTKFQPHHHGPHFHHNHHEYEQNPFLRKMMIKSTCDFCKDTCDEDLPTTTPSSTSSTSSTPYPDIDIRFDRNNK